MMYLFFSNYLEALDKILQESLYSLTPLPFAERWIVVPSQEMGEWITRELAQAKNIACGVDVLFLNACIQKLAGKTIPRSASLFLRIEQAMREACLSHDPIWEPLIRYIGGKERRLLLLTKKLTSLFLQYGVYGKKSCAEWESHPKGWQEALWQKVFRERGDYPLKLFTNLTSQERDSLSIHLFGFTHLPPLYFDLFDQLSSSISISLYQLSPCKEYWGDSDHPLLGSWGKIGKRMGQLLLTSECHTMDCYVSPEPDTQLHLIQQALLHHLPLETVLEDDSIQIHLSCSPHLEIENLFHTLVTSGQEPKDILVMAPDIVPYIPSIRAIFGEKFPYKISGIPSLKRDQKKALLFHLLRLEENRWSAPFLWELFQNPLFASHHRLDEEKLLTIKKWIFSSHITWGYDLAHRNRLLSKRHCERAWEEKRGTWVEGIGALIEELALPHDPPQIDLIQGELLGEFALLLKSLYTTLSPFYEGGERPFSEWVEELRKVNERFLGEKELGVDFPPSSHLCPFSSLLFLLEEICAEETFTEGGHEVQAVHFCPLAISKSLPSPWIVLLGMHEHAFPRKERLSSLDLVKDRPLHEDLDRYLFLETVVAARKKLQISYCGEEGPSVVVAELIPYISSKQIICHPRPFLTNLKKREKFGLKVPPPRSYEELPPLITIEISDFLRALRSPFSSFSEKEFPHEESFILSPLQKSTLHQKAFQRGADGLSLTRERGNFPLGVFGAIAEKELLSEIEEMKKWPLSSLKTYELYAHRKSCEEVEKGLWRIPAPHFMWREKEVVFIGNLERVMDEGLLVLEKKGVKGAVRSWPLFLLFSLIEKGGELFFAKEKKKEGKSPFFEDPAPYLTSLIDYYFLRQTSPSLLFPEWIEALVKEDRERLEKVYNPQRHPVPPAFDQIIEEWAPLAKKIYGEMVHAWF